MNYLTSLYVKASSKFEGLVKNERGSQTLEWVGIAAVIVIVVGMISQVFNNNTDLGEAIMDKFTSWIDKIGGE